MGSHATGVKEALAAFRKLPKDASVELKDANQKITDVLAGKIRTAATASSAQSALVAPGIKARRGAKPTVVAGGNKLVGRNRKPLHKVLFGANFGATVLKQFRPHRGAGQDDYWFYKTVEANQGEFTDEWLRSLDDVLGRWARG